MNELFGGIGVRKIHGVNQTVPNGYAAVQEINPLIKNKSEKPPQGARHHSTHVGNISQLNMTNSSNMNTEVR